MLVWFFFGAAEMVKFYNKNIIIRKRNNSLHNLHLCLSSTLAKKIQFFKKFYWKNFINGNEIFLLIFFFAIENILKERKNVFYKSSLKILIALFLKSSKMLLKINTFLPNFGDYWFELEKKFCKLNSWWWSFCNYWIFCRYDFELISF